MTSKDTFETSDSLICVFLSSLGFEFYDSKFHSTVRIKSQLKRKTGLHKLVILLLFRSLVGEQLLNHRCDLKIALC